MEQRIGAGTQDHVQFTVQRLGVAMAPEPGNTLEQEGVLNPAGIAGPGGRYYLFPRLVAAGNYSRIGIARLRRDAGGRPSGVERLGLALEPEEPYELQGAGRGGCEDARVTFLPCAGLYVMAYTALGPRGPRVALASSSDLLSWRRHGLVDFAPALGVDFNAYQNKDAMLLPGSVLDPEGRPALAMLHRPMYEAWDGTSCHRLPLPLGVADGRPSMWISYCRLDRLDWLAGPAAPRFTGHHLLARPEAPWESYRIGGGTVPLATARGWLTFYHGVRLRRGGGRCYQAGALLLDREDPRRILSRSRAPIFGPRTIAERRGVVNNVVFPTAVEEFPDWIDLFYGMADSRIGVARLTSRSAGAEECAA